MHSTSVTNISTTTGSTWYSLWLLLFCMSLLTGGIIGRFTVVPTTPQDGIHIRASPPSQPGNETNKTAVADKVDDLLFIVLVPLVVLDDVEWCRCMMMMNATTTIAIGTCFTMNESRYVHVGGCRIPTCGAYDDERHNLYHHPFLLPAALNELWIVDSHRRISLPSNPIMVRTNNIRTSTTKTWLLDFCRRWSWRIGFRMKFKFVQVILRWICRRIPHMQILQNDVACGLERNSQQYHHVNVAWGAIKLGNDVMPSCISHGPPLLGDVLIT